MMNAVKHKVIYISDQDNWAEYIHNAVEYDFYHTWYYHSLEENGIPLLYIYEEMGIYIAFPLVKRPIPNSPLFDLTSVYGYVGPVSNKKMESLHPDFLEGFRQDFLDFLETGRYVSVFSRLHPYFNQAPVMQLFPGLHANGKVVAIDLDQSLDTQRAAYHRSFRQQIRSLKNKGYVVAETKDPEDIRAFASVYMENMQRIGASNYYLFSEDYFIKLLSSKEFVSSLVLVYLEGIPVCGAVAISTTTVMQVHLLATRTLHLPASPSKLLVDELTIIARDMGCRYLNLGGGVGFKEDNLFTWKAGFSSLFLDYYSWRFVVNEPRYNELLEENNIKCLPQTDFFPLYRYTPEC
jgi:hypothetical protein